MGRLGYVNLTSMEDVRRFIAKLINQRRNGEITTTMFRDLVYGTKALREVLEGLFLQSEIMERLARLEGDTYVPHSISQGNGRDEDDDLDEPNEEAGEGETWA